MLNFLKYIFALTFVISCSFASASTLTEWNHNGSKMTIGWTDTTITILYKEPRKGMLDAGAKPDTLLMNGTITGNDISGTARIFAGKCGSFTYPVFGSFSPDNRNIQLKGYAPVIDRNTCQQIKTIPDTLDFNYLNPVNIVLPDQPKSTESNAQESTRKLLKDTGFQNIQNNQMREGK